MVSFWLVSSLTFEYALLIWNFKSMAMVLPLSAISFAATTLGHPSKVNTSGKQLSLPSTLSSVYLFNLYHSFRDLMPCRVPDTMVHAYIFSPQLQCKLMESRNCLEVFLSFFVLQPHCLQCLVFCYTLGKVSPKQYFFWICKLMEKRKNTNENVLYSRGNSVLCGEQNGKEIPKRGDICTHMADSLCCTAETNTTL